MAIRRIYHGSYYLIREPIFGMGNAHNDYGRGFYCTENLGMAQEWACSRRDNGMANVYDLQTDGLQIIQLNNKGYHILNWLAILLENRIFDLDNPISNQGRKYILDHFLPDYKKADILIGYRADDSYFSFARDFLNNTITLEQLRHAMRLGKLGEQIVLKSPEAFEALRFVGAQKAEKEIWYPRKVARDRMARNAYSEMRQEFSDGTFLIDMIRQKWENDDTRL